MVSLAAGKLSKPAAAPKPLPSSGSDTPEDRKAAAIEALAKLDPKELGELMSGDDDGATDAH